MLQEDNKLSSKENKEKQKTGEGAKIEKEELH